MGIRLKVLDPNENCPAASVAEQVQGDFSDFDTVRSWPASSIDSAVLINLCIS